MVATHLVTSKLPISVEVLARQALAIEALLPILGIRRTEWIL
jgi:hypothetical protein